MFARGISLNLLFPAAVLPRAPVYQKKPCFPPITALSSTVRMLLIPPARALRKANSVLLGMLSSTV
jgi:hypothetical protein